MNFDENLRKINETCTSQQRLSHLLGMIDFVERVGLSKEQNAELDRIMDGVDIPDETTAAQAPEVVDRIESALVAAFRSAVLMPNPAAVRELIEAAKVAAYGHRVSDLMRLRRALEDLDGYRGPKEEA